MSLAAHGMLAIFNPFSPTLFLIVAKMSLPKRSGPYWSNARFVTFRHSDILRSVLNARVPEYQNVRKDALGQYDPALTL